MAESLDLSPCGGSWAGCRIDGDTLMLANGEVYTARELQFMRWELNNFRRIAEVSQRDLERSGKPDAVVFDLDELTRIREAIELLDNKLPGFKFQQRVREEVLGARSRRMRR